MCFRAVETWAQGAHWMPMEKDTVMETSELSNMISNSEVPRQTIWNQVPSSSPLHSQPTSFSPQPSLSAVSCVHLLFLPCPQSGLSMSFSSRHSFSNIPFPSSISTTPSMPFSGRRRTEHTDLHKTFSPNLHHAIPSPLPQQVTLSPPLLISPNEGHHERAPWSPVSASPILPPLSVCLSSLRGRKVPYAFL